MIATLVANLIALGGLLLLGWSVWMAVAIYWLENLLALPALAIRIRRAVPHLSAAELEGYLAARDGELSNGVSEGRRLRAVLAERGQAGAASVVARRFLLFYGAFALAHGLFVLVLGTFSTAIATGGDAEALPDLAVFDWPALVLAAILIGAAEVLGLRLDRRPLMPDVGAYTRRTIVLHVTIVLGAVVLTMLGAVGLAILFVALKTVADLGAARRAGDWVPWGARTP